MFQSQFFALGEKVIGAGSHRSDVYKAITTGAGQTERLEGSDFINPDNNRRLTMELSDEAGASTVTHSYGLPGDRDRVWVISLRPWTISTPTPTLTSTPTLTLTPSSTPTPTQTGTIDPTSTPTQAGTEPAPPALGTSQYTYDGDGNLVKSVIDGVSTYYMGKIYEKEVEGQSEVERKYYSLGGQRFAVREDSTLNWIMSDHLGSTAVSANADGSWRGEIAYTPFGEMRESRGVTLTDYRYTGQRGEEEIGLIFFNARWEDPVLGKFTQADTLIPDPGNPLSLDRYAYTTNNPVKYVDPTGHVVEYPYDVGSLLPDPDPPPLQAPQTETYEDYFWTIRDTFTQNTNAALEICGNNQFSVGNQAFACGYLVAEGIPVVAIAGAASLTVVGVWEMLASGSTAACADGDCTNEVNAGLDIVKSNSDKVREVGDDIVGWLGNDPIGFRNKAGDFVLRNAENTRRFRYDFNYTNPHTNPHFHLDWLNEVGKWMTERIFPGNLPPY